MTTRDPEIRQRAVVVTGGSRGIGAAVVRALAGRGVPVCLNYAARSEDARALAAELAAGGARCIAVQADVGDPASIERLFEVAERELGPLGGLVNNAGFLGQAGRRVETVDVATLRRTFDVNVIGPMLCAQQALRRLSTSRGGKGGRIVNVSSIGSRTGSPNDWVDYAASKGALNTFTIGLARELAREGVQVTGVSPGVVDTGLHADAGAPQRLERLSQATPMGRPADPGEIADVVVWALLDAPDYLTGTTIEVAGGL